MLSDRSFAPIPSDTCPEDDFLPTLDFDDLLDIARECEFTRTITHLWPCEESAFPETGLEDIVLAAIVPTPNAEVCPSTSTSSMNPDRSLPQVDPHRSTSVCHMPDINASLSGDSTLPPTPSQLDDGTQTTTEVPIASILRGWSPPNGSQFLDLDDNLTFPHLTNHDWVSPWLATCQERSNTQSANNISQSSAALGIGNVQLPSPEPEPKAPAVSNTDKAVHDPARKCLPRGCLSAQPLIRPILQPVRAGPVNSNVRDQTATTSHAKTTKSWPQVPFVPATDRTSTVTYARAPRGGIPPHIARTVTKANFFRMENERKVMQHAFSSVPTEQGKKPSVLRRAARKTNKIVNGGTGKESSESGKKDEKEGRVVKRARL